MANSHRRNMMLFQLGNSREQPQATMEDTCRDEFARLNEAVAAGVDPEHLPL